MNITAVLVVLVTNAMLCVKELIKINVFLFSDIIWNTSKHIVFIVIKDGFIIMACSSRCIL